MKRENARTSTIRSDWRVLFASWALTEKGIDTNIKLLNEIAF